MNLCGAYFQVESKQNGLYWKDRFAGGKDGIRFTKHPEPVLIPNNDFDQFGYEDPRIIKIRAPIP